jgi:hypothetical protein
MTLAQVIFENNVFAGFDFAQPVNSCALSEVEGLPLFHHAS